MKNRATLTFLSIYAVSMGLLEAAVVVYMRRLYYASNPKEIFPLEFLNSYDPALELSREAATIGMILAVACLAERSSLTRTFAAFAFVFGAWDLWYYVWLKVLMDWPSSWWEWDVLFLIPSLWLGPWICPALIALLFVVWGGWTLQSSRAISFTPRSLATFVIGAALGLVAFMEPAWTVTMSEGTEALSQYTPEKFWWWLFGISLVLMAGGLGMTLRGTSPGSASDESFPAAEKAGPTIGLGQ